MPWGKARNRYQCFRCKGYIDAGEMHFYSGDNVKYYRYHAICKSISGRKEATMTKNLASFIKQVKKGPILSNEFVIVRGHCCMPSTLYRNCVMMGLPIYKHVFTVSGNHGKQVIYFMHKDRHKALERVLELCNNKQNYIREHVEAILDKKEILKMRGRKSWEGKSSS